MRKKDILAGRLLWAAAAILAVGAGTYFRLYPITVYPQYAAKNKAQLLVYSGIRRSIDQLISEKTVGLPAAEKNAMRKTAFGEYLSEQKIKVDTAVDQAAQKIFSDTKALKKRPYLMEVDPYYYLSLTERLLTKEAPPRPIRGREYLNEMMLAPSGAWYPWDYHPYTGLVVYKFLAMGWKNIPLEIAVGCVPLFLAGLCLVPFFFISRKIFSLNPAPTLIGACYLTLAPAYLRRSLWGWFDTDSYNILFPLLILLCLFFYLGETNSHRKKTAYLVAANLAAGVYSLFWRGWLLEYALIWGSLLVCLFFTGAGHFPGEKRSRLKQAATFFVLSPPLLTFLLWGWQGLLSLLKEAADMTKNFYLPTFSLWPDAFLSVGELKHSDILSVASALGGLPVLAFFFIGILLPLLNRTKRSDPFRARLVFISVLFGLTVLLGIKIERFTLLAVAPAAIGVALGAEKIASFTKNSKLFSPASVRNFGYALLLGIIFWQAHTAVKFEHPIYNSSWDNAMTYLRENTPRESIVTSWWCPGHFITSMGKRRVTFDGATQNTPQIYWVANLFLENSEARAAATLRMLDLSGNNAVDLLTQKLKLSEAVALIRNILPLDKAKALELSKSRLSPPDPARLVAMTHGTHSPPPAYVFIYNDMVEQVMALEYTGKWNFEKAENFLDHLQRKPSGIPKKLLDHSSTDHVRLAWSLAEGPYAEDNDAYEDHRTGQTVYFTNGLALDLLSMEARLSSSRFGTGIPKNIYYLDAGHLEKKTIQGSDLNISALIIRDGVIGSDGQMKVTYRSVLADEHLLESLLFRLYYLKGRGLSHFKLVFEEEDLSNRTKVYVFKVLWDAE